MDVVEWQDSSEGYSAFYREELLARLVRAGEHWWVQPIVRCSTKPPDIYKAAYACEQQARSAVEKYAEDLPGLSYDASKPYPLEDF